MRYPHTLNKSASQVSKERQPHYCGFLAEVTVVGLPTLPQNCTWLRAILNCSVGTHIEALEHAKILVDKLLDVGINEGMREPSIVFYGSTLTSVPTFTLSKSAITSLLCIRIQPWETACPINCGWFVP